MDYGSLGNNPLGNISSSTVDEMNSIVASKVEASTGSNNVSGNTASSSASAEPNAGVTTTGSDLLSAGELNQTTAFTNSIISDGSSTLSPGPYSNANDGGVGVMGGGNYNLQDFSAVDPNQAPGTQGFYGDEVVEEESEAGEELDAAIFRAEAAGSKAAAGSKIPRPVTAGAGRVPDSSPSANRPTLAGRRPFTANARAPTSPQASSNNNNNNNNHPSAYTAVQSPVILDRGQQPAIKYPTAYEFANNIDPSTSSSAQLQQDGNGSSFPDVPVPVYPDGVGELGGVETNMGSGVLGDDDAGTVGTHATDHFSVVQSTQQFTGQSVPVPEPAQVAGENMMDTRAGAAFQTLNPVSGGGITGADVRGGMLPEDLYGGGDSDAFTAPLASGYNSSDSAAAANMSNGGRLSGHSDLGNGVSRGGAAGRMHLPPLGGGGNAGTGAEAAGMLAGMMGMGGSMGGAKVYPGGSPPMVGESAWSVDDSLLQQTASVVVPDRAATPSPGPRSQHSDHGFERRPTTAGMARTTSSGSGGLGASGRPATAGGRPSMMATPFTPNSRTRSDVPVEQQRKERSKLRVGRYTINNDVLNIKKFIVVPSGYLKSDKASMREVFSKIGLEMPTTMFRALQTDDPRNWNVKLPPTRNNLADLMENHLNPKSKKVEKETNLYSMFGNMPVKDDVESGADRLVGMLARQLDDSSREDADIEAGGVGPGVEPAGTESFTCSDLPPPPPIIHYQAVLRDNCKRFVLETGRALAEVGATIRVNPSWANDIPDDAVADWMKDETGTTQPVPMIGVANCSDFHPDIWDLLDGHAKVVYDDDEADGSKLAELGEEANIDPEPFYNGDIVVSRNPVDHMVVNSMPHPGMTHLIMTDDPRRFEIMLAQSCPAGLIMINGSPTAGSYFSNAILRSQPIIIFKNTGYTSDIACEMLENVDALVRERLDNNPGALAECPYPDTIVPGYHHKGWLMPFNTHYVSDCCKMNALIENFPHRFDPRSVYVVDMFRTSGDELQDRITQTMSVVFAPPHELGGTAAEAKRLGYAWQMRLQCAYNAQRFKWQSDVLNFLLILFILLATLSAVWLTFLEIHGPMIVHDDTEWFKEALLKGNLVLPLIATIIRGVINILNPMAKFVALKNAAVRVETEIYMYRCKVGKYSNFQQNKQPAEISKDKSKDKKGGGGAETNVKTRSPRTIFSAALERVWNKLAASDLSNGSLEIPPSTMGALDETNKRILKNRAEQEIHYSDDITSEEQRLKKMRLSERIYSVLCCCFYKSRKKITPSQLKDIGISDLSVDDYLYLRLYPIVAELSKKTPSLARFSHSITICAVLLSVSASGLSTFGYSVFIPLVLALVGSMTAWGSYHQTEYRLVMTNAAVSQLNQLLVWWDGLTLIEKRVPKNKDRLVAITEETIQNQATIFSGASTYDDDALQDGGNEEAEE